MLLNRINFISGRYCVFEWNEYSVITIGGN